MTTDLQRAALEVLAEIWKLSPDVRLGQLMAHLGFLAETHVGKGLGYIDDDELIAVMYRHRGELIARLQGTVEEVAVSVDAGTSISGSATIAEAASAPHGTGSPGGAYPGTCRELSDAARMRHERAGRRPALRLRSGGEVVRVQDRLHGSYASVVDDVVLRRNDGTVRIDAPGFAPSSSNSMLSSMLFGGMGSFGRDNPATRLPEMEGSFTVTTDGQVLANNTESGPVTAPGGQQLQWNVNVRSAAAPM